MWPWRLVLAKWIWGKEPSRAGPQATDGYKRGMSRGSGCGPRVCLRRGLCRELAENVEALTLQSLGGVGGGGKNDHREGKIVQLKPPSFH